MCLCRVRMLLLAIGALALASDALAEVKPNALFTDHMVLQRDKPVKVWGTAAAGEKVAVRLGEHSAETTADDGNWEVELKAMPAGGPHMLRIEGADRKIELSNVLVGEIWIASGQSNMQWSIKQGEDPDRIAAEAKHPRIRLFTVKRGGSPEPLENVEGRWVECSPETVGDFSAVAYHFGVALQNHIDVPIGLISTNVGGTAAQRWTPAEVLQSTPELEKYAEQRNASDLYNAMIHPLLKFSIRGAIWYQGESNAGEAHRYRVLFPAMIKSWRDRWGQDEFPFLFVQLAPFMKIEDQPQQSAWAELREAQLMTLSKSPNSAMAVITDVGDEKDIHPKPKKPVGERLAVAARALAYDEKVEHSGPIFESLITSGERAILRFKHTGEGLEVRGDTLTGFTIAGEDKKFHNATAKIEGDTVIVSSPEVTAPVAVRFGWANYPVVNLWNKDGLPASPFRTDSWPGVTEGK